MLSLLARYIGLSYSFLRYKIKYRSCVRFKGFTVVYAFPDSEIDFKKGKNGEKTDVNSHWLSNLMGLYQRTIIVARYGGKIEIGPGCGISGSTIYSMESITIGSNVLIGGNCKIIDNDFHPLLASKRNPQKPDDIVKKAIVIGDDCFIGANSIILKGTTLGRDCVVGAGSVVSGPFPDHVVIAGNPAKVIKKNE